MPDYERGREDEHLAVLLWLRFWYPNSAHELADKIEAGEHRRGRHLAGHNDGPEEVRLAPLGYDGTREGG